MERIRMITREEKNMGAPGADNICCHPDDSMTGRLKHIWQVCFGDSREYIDFYFQRRFRPEEMLVCLAEGQPVSMLSLLPAQLCYQGRRQPIRYVYAVATLPEYRGRGCARLLLEEASRRLQVPLALVPASGSLGEYYGRLGFRNAFAIDEITITPEEIAACGSERYGQEYWLLTVTPGEYYRIREEYLSTMGISTNGYVSWDEAAIAYALQENDFADGYAYKVRHHGREDILLFREEDHYIRVLETTLSVPEVTAVMKRLRIKRPVTVRTAVNAAARTENLYAAGIEAPEAADCGAGHGGHTYGMLLGGPEITEGYLNLTLE